MDKSVGHIVAALAEKEILKNTLIVFVSDNGAAGSSQNFGSNLPLRGLKSTPWEGAARAVAVVWHPTISHRVSNAIIHVTDWLPTLITAAGGKPPNKIDGLDQWATITKAEQPKRNDVLITIDDLNGWAAFREGDFKIIVGNVTKEKSKYHGKELMALKHDAMPYETVLLESEAYLVFKETLDLPLDMEQVYEQRNSSKLVGSDDIPDEAVCFPTFGKFNIFIS